MFTNFVHMSREQCNLRFYAFSVVFSVSYFIKHSIFIVLCCNNLRVVKNIIVLV